LSSWAQLALHFKAGIRVDGTGEWEERERNNTANKGTMTRRPERAQPIDYIKENK